jgi:predicted Kef-type K+ transport protein
VTYDVPDAHPRRWAALVLLGGRLLTNWLRRRHRRPGWRTVVCAGVVVTLAVAAGLPAAHLARSALGLTALTAGVSTGGGWITTFFT